ncbi:MULTISPECIES: ATP-dependent zinc metalloprotease FtsH [Pseudomonadaceae]|uniref:ATP-dependent zinc metalloprotease FtsH n=1 Tax=Ectopseudomonas toyotomiensis TaxID=554344 RepID=A0AA42IJE3_9GAMM|nr:MULTISPECIES: ATP-dependent zinc metalloprotease FtsH [Pseudomonas]AQZ32489.1 ATP-dependent metalloprotease [Pseudomonas sp. LPH1]MBG0841385.1 ATP-dependent metallopeptidase FtsH/Yme1/Tma family protein [Pseudomonas toyotomiensis]MBG0845820.1 ATP-dependent metallopeptidase FtsH/Yme1/Tma family protein [Pseudomonas chengduensis]MDH0700438.1 ATP-dependent zinc metalloprotease FtsH [Pseudomonas toyotomiensis]MDH0958215.1 ATP-dependent zinc metalloprotease FtsH [Pseudomonas chengduensis]
MAKNLILWLIIAAVLVTVMNNFSSPSEPQTLSYSQFIEQVKEGRVERVTVDGYVITGKRTDGEGFKTIRPAIQDGGLIGDLIDNNVVIEGKQPEQQSIWTQLLVASFPILVIIAVFMFFMRQMQGGAGGKGGPMSFGKSKARLLSEDQVKTTFADVAGCDEAKEEVSELVEFLRDPGKFQRLGGRIPRGVLMVGSPGTGKTLLAKAVAGEAKVPFFTISGSDFVEMFVGVGASRVRDMFDQAKKHAPCIIFIDEIDAVGRHRGAGMGGGHDEREQTLNQLLVEMDGFEMNDGIIVIAATNRPDVLDPALLRPGRFDRQVVVGLPDIRGREQILKVHMRKVPMGDDVNPAVIARGTPGFSGADLANLVNEASLFAARAGKRLVEMKEFELAKDKIMMGAERKTMVMSDKEKLNTAFHEAGHAIVGRLVPEHDPVYKVSIIPRGRALGVTMFLPEEDRYSLSKRALISQICSLFGGRIAEEMTLGFDGVTTGASNDIMRATQLAKNMVTKWGLSEKLGPLMYAEEEGEVFLGRSMGSQASNVSGETAKQIDEEVRRIIDECYATAKKLLVENRDKLDAMAEALMKYETIDAEQIDDIMNGREPREPRGWDGGGDSGAPQAKVDEPDRSEKPIGGPAAEH